jgi:hypothetical protein
MASSSSSQQQQQAPPSIMVKLATLDDTGKEFTVEKSVAERSVLLRNMLEDIGEPDKPIPIPNVSSAILEKV